MRDVDRGPGPAADVEHLLQRRGSLLLVALSICIFLFGALCWGIFVSAAAKTQMQAYQMGILSSFLPAFLLSGFIYSIDNMPWVIRLITHIIPHFTHVRLSFILTFFLTFLWSLYCFSFLLFCPFLCSFFPASTEGCGV